MTTRWLKIEFYGQVEDELDLDPLEIADKLSKAFPFSHIDELTITEAKPDEANHA